MQPSENDHDIVLVDTDDREIGTCSKLLAHQEGKLHRAVSVFVFDRDDRLMIQRRAIEKYHSGGLWSNTCCTHPGPGKSPAEAGAQRLLEEMGFTCELTPAGHFVYRAEFGDGLTEYEYDHVFAGQFDGTPTPNPSEVCDWRWISRDELEHDRLQRIQDYSAWFWKGARYADEQSPLTRLMI